MAQAPTHSARGRREPGEVLGTGFTLFTDMLVVGLLTSAACLPVVTAPAAFAAASTLLRQTADHGPSATASAYLAHLRARLTAGSLAGGLLVPVLVVVLLIDAAVVRSALPGAHVMAPALVLVAFACAVAALRATALAPPHQLSPREALLRTVGDPRGTLLLAAAVLLVALLAWSIPVLIPLLPGPLAFAATAVDIRYTAR